MIRKPTTHPSYWMYLCPLYHKGNSKCCLLTDIANTMVSPLWKWKEAASLPGSFDYKFNLVLDILLGYFRLFLSWKHVQCCMITYQLDLSTAHQSELTTSQSIKYLLSLTAVVNGKFGSKAWSGGFCGVWPAFSSSNQDLAISNTRKALQLTILVHTLVTSVLPTFHNHSSR